MRSLVPGKNVVNPIPGETGEEYSFVPVLSPLRRKIAGNVAWVAAGNVFQTLLSLFVIALMARQLGPDQFGMLNYAINLVIIFTAIASLGMEGIVIREIVKRPRLTPEILGTAFALRLIGACCAVALVLLTAWVIRVDRSSIPYIMLIALAFIPQSLDVIDLWFQKNIQSKFSMLARSVGVIAGAGIKLFLLFVHAPLIYFCMAYLLDFSLIAAAFAWIYRHRSQEIGRWRFSKKIAMEILWDSWPMMVSGVLIVAYMRIEQILVMNILGSHSAGMYFASARVMEVWALVPVILLNSIYPVLVHKRSADPENYRRLIQSVFDLMTAAGFMLAAITCAMANPIMHFLYGPEYSPASRILAIQAWTVPVLFCGAARGCYFLLENTTIYHAWAAAIGMLVNVALAMPLMEKFGAPGAAAAALFSYIVSIYGTSCLFPRLRHCAGLQLRALLLPLRFREFKRGSIPSGIPQPSH